MKPTTWRLLLGTVAVSAALGWAVFRVWESTRSELPNLPWSAPVVIGVFAVAVFFTALRLRPRLQRRPGHKPLHPLVAARYAALALATSRTGAVPPPVSRWPTCRSAAPCSSAPVPRSTRA